MNIEEVLAKRDDISQFLVHLTRDTLDWDENTAEQNLISILEDKAIHAYKHHCLFSPLINKLDDKIQKKFNTVCFTETPLNKICHLLDVDRRQIELKPFGLVFTKDTIIENSGNPCLYTNGDHNKALEKYLWSLYRESEKNDFNDDFYKLGAITNTFKEKHNFSWEREWRVFKKFKVKPNNVFAIISANSEIKLPDEYLGIPIINPNWSYEEIVYQLSLQLWNMRS